MSIILAESSLVTDARSQVNVQREDGLARHAAMIFVLNAEVRKLIQTVRMDIYCFGQLMHRSIPVVSSHVTDASHLRVALMEDGTVMLVALTSVLTADLNNNSFNHLSSG
jgi:hypothetical protein